MPMYNERNIANNIKETMKSMSWANYTITVVDDGSKKTDCISEARKVKDKRVRVVGYKDNMGKGYALKYGFGFIKARDDDLVVFLDSDLELHPRQIKEIIKIQNGKESLPEEAEVVIGSKKHPLSKVHYPLFRRFMSWIYQVIIHTLFDLRVKDTQVGLKIFRYGVLKEVFPKILVKRFAFDLELLVNINKLGYKIVEVPIKLDYKFASRINPRAVFYIWLDTTAIFYRLKILRYYDKSIG